MSKLPPTSANKVSGSSGTASGFCGIGAAGESDDTTVTPNERDEKGGPKGTTSFAGGDHEN